MQRAGVSKCLTRSVGHTWIDPEVSPPVAIPNPPSHEMTLVDDHVRVEHWPAVIAGGFAPTVKVGAGGGGGGL